MPVLTRVDPNTAGGRIRLVREANGLTQAALASKVFVTQPAVAQWEANRWIPSHQSQVHLAEALGTTRHALFGEAAR